MEVQKKDTNQTVHLDEVLQESVTDLMYLQTEHINTNPNTRRVFDGRRIEM